MRSRLHHTLPVLLLAASVLGCGGGGENPGDPKDNEEHGGTKLEDVKPHEGDWPLKIVCTTGMVADIVENIGGDHVSAFVVVDETFERDGERLLVQQLFGAGIDPHTQRPSTTHTQLLNEADAILYSGLHLEGTLTDILERLARKKVIYAVTADLDHDKLLVDEEQHDPHCWMDVSIWMEAADHVGTLLSKLDPDHADDYAANLKTYREKLTALDTYAREQIASIPEDQRVLVTAHDAFAYFAKAYGLTVKSVQGISTESAASVQDVNELVDFLVERRIKSVFIETSVNPRNVQALIEGCQAKDHEVKVGGELFSDAMDEPGEPAGTYEGMIRHNVDTIVGALK